ncbi:MAG: methyltransferase domain-containing protein [Gemmatimonadota bacterium]
MTMDADSRHYVHGYAERESRRLFDQAATLAGILHADTAYPAGSVVLEAGCGVGAQTVVLAAKSPGARLVSVDVSSRSLATARTLVAEQGLGNVSFLRADLFELPFAPGSFDHAFVCFVLEHLPDPVGALLRLKAAVKPGGTVTVIEGDHGSTFLHPDCPESRRVVRCLVEIQAGAGGDAEIGRRLYPVLVQAGFRDVHVSPRMVYVDASRPGLVEGFTRNTFIAMIEGVRDTALSHGLVDGRTWEKGIAGLRRTTEPDGVFCYTFFKGVARI